MKLFSVSTDHLDIQSNVLIIMYKFDIYLFIFVFLKIVTGYYF